MCHPHKQLITIHRLIHKDTETVSRDSADCIPVGKAARQTVCDLMQHLISGCITMLVDQLLIVVDIDTDHIKLTVRRVHNMLLNALFELYTIP